jgi:hypothetical protein
MTLVVPCDPLDPRRVDPHFAEEASAAQALGHAVLKVDHDALTRGRTEDVLPRRPPATAVGPALYRGWMVTPTEYAVLEALLGTHDVTLSTTSVNYRDAHELPGWYLTFEHVTPESVWTGGDDVADLIAAATRSGFGRAVLRDYSKSLKSYWEEACLVPDAQDGAALARTAKRFLELRDPFSGGFVLRRFEDFTGAEARSWWVRGEHVLTTAHPDTAGPVPEPDLSEVAPLVAELNLPFVTLDLVARTDGTWRLVELGDGQVSDRPTSTSAEDFLAAVLGPA